MSKDNDVAFNRVVGRPVTEPTQEVIEKIVNTLRLGAYIETAVVLAGVPKRTFYLWAKKGNEDPDSIYGQLLHAVERAQEEATARDLLVIDQCANGKKAEYERDEKGNLILDPEGNPILLQQRMIPNWNASAWRLERRRPKEWGRTEKIEHSGPGGGPIESAAEDPAVRDERIKRNIETLRLIGKL